MSKLRTPRVRMRRAAAGMSRFFSAVNLDRYRKLASPGIGETEQHQLLEDLAEEMSAFKRGARVAANRRSAFREGLSSIVAAEL